MSAALHVVVVGAGIVGAATAEALAVDGVRVTVIESDIPGGGATAADMGHRLRGTSKASTAPYLKSKTRVCWRPSSVA